MTPYYQDEFTTIYHADCRDLTFESISAIVCDPPYELGFMGKLWDSKGVSFQKETWEHLRKCCLPGSPLLSFGGTRTFHRIACAIEDAGWEIRDTICWVYSQGFPKSLSISKSLDSLERNTWLNINKALDKNDIIEIWKRTSSNVSFAETLYPKNTSEAGPSISRSNIAQGLVVLSLNQEKSLSTAIIAELKSLEAHRLLGVDIITAQENVGMTTLPSPSLAISAERLLQSPEVKQSIITSIAQWIAKELLKENTELTIKEDEILKTWLGKKKSLNEQDINVLYAGVIQGLKLTILSQSKTFRNLDLKSRTGYVLATNVIITKSIAESLISFTVDILKSKAIDKQFGTEREQLISTHNDMFREWEREEMGQGAGTKGNTFPLQHTYKQGLPATPEAQLWEGYGTGLKPSYEPILVCMNPLEGTFAGNALKHKVAGLNIDDCRVGYQSEQDKIEGQSARLSERKGHNQVFASGDRSQRSHIKGRFPANFLHDGSDEVLELFPNSKGAFAPVKRGQNGKSKGIYGDYASKGDDGASYYGDSGSAARFFYCAKSSRRERDAGLEEMPDKIGGGMQGTADQTLLTGSGNIRNNKMKNNHPTVKPLALMEYLCKLVKMPEYNLVLDSFMGSGTTLLACRKLGIKSIGVDSDEQACEIAAKRCSQAMQEVMDFSPSFERKGET